MLEASCHAENSFVTLTHRDETLPKCSDGLTPTLNPVVVRDWLKRLREKCNRILPNWRLRFYLVGEYGDEAERPHYHVALFGYKGCIYGDSKFAPSWYRTGACGCASCLVIASTWGLGRVHQGVLERKSAQYLAGYTVKGMTKHEDVRLHGRFPEFARQSRRPGIGSSAVPVVAQAALKYGLDASRYDGGSLRHGRGHLPLGRLLSGKLQKQLGREKVDYADPEVLALRAHLERVAADKGHSVSKAWIEMKIAEALENKNQVFNAQISAKEKLFMRGKREAK